MSGSEGASPKRRRQSSPQGSAAGTVHERWDRCALTETWAPVQQTSWVVEVTFIPRGPLDTPLPATVMARYVAAETARPADDELVPVEDDWLDALPQGMLWRADELSFSNSRTVLTLNTLLRIWSAGPNSILTFGIPLFLSFTLQLSSGHWRAYPFTNLHSLIKWKA
jgi:hypothetical protein